MTAVFVVQANGRDHHGMVLLVTTDEVAAQRRVRQHIVEHNSGEFDPTYIAEDAKSMPLAAFVERYNSAWVDSAFYCEHEVEPVGESQ